MQQILNPTWYDYSFSFGSGQADSIVRYLSAMALNTKAQERGRRYRILCHEPADVFDPSPAYEVERARLWTLIQEARNLDWLLLTAQPAQVLAQVPRCGYWRSHVHQLPANVWVGALIDGPATRGRLMDLLRVPTQNRFVAYLPLRGPVPYPLSDTSRPRPVSTRLAEQEHLLLCARCGAGIWDSERRCRNCYCDARLEWDINSMVQWVVAGGAAANEQQSEDWLRALLHNFRSYQVPFYFAQAGAYLAQRWNCADPTGGALTELPAEFQVRELPETWQQQAY